VRLGRKKNWGSAPWVIDFRASSDARAIPDEVDFAIVGGGFTGLAAAACLRRMDVAKSCGGVLKRKRLEREQADIRAECVLEKRPLEICRDWGDVLNGFSGLLGELAVDW